MPDLDPVFLLPESYRICGRCSGIGRDPDGTRCSNCQGLGTLKTRPKPSRRRSTERSLLPLEKPPESYAEAVRRAEQKRAELLREIDAEMTKLGAIQDPTFDAFPSSRGEYLNNLLLTVSKIDLEKGVSDLEDMILRLFQQWQGLNTKILEFGLACIGCVLAKTEEEFPFLKKTRGNRHQE